MGLIATGRRRRRTRSSGFTLIELLVVIGIIMLIASFVVVGGTGGGDSAAIRASQQLIMGVATGARSQAILSGEEARLIIHNDPDDPERYLRYIGIIHYREADAGNLNSGEGWVAGTDGVYLPKGVYFNPEMTDSNSGGAWGTEDTMRIEYPRSVAQPEGSGTEYFYFSFNPNGTVTKNQNAWIVLKADTLIPSPTGDGYEFRSETDPGYKEFLRTALILRRSGSTTLVDDPEKVKD